MSSTVQVSTTLLKEHRIAKIFKVDQQPILIIEATAEYIPLEAFKELFKATGTLVKTHRINTLVFDKRKMKIFHQPSMEWYYTEWKEEMFSIGLKKHRKILPMDQLFRHSVKVGREKIFAQYPDAAFTKIDIQYAESVEEALAL